MSAPFYGSLIEWLRALADEYVTDDSNVTAALVDAANGLEEREREIVRLRHGIEAVVYNESSGLMPDVRAYLKALL
jgi:hypothetical protein